MRIFLKQRAATLTENMDSPDCDRERLFNTFRQFRVINVILSRARSVYRRWIRPVMARSAEREWTLLDIGFGGGDIALAMARWAERDGLKLRITGIEIDGRALDYVAGLARPDNVEFRLADVHALARSGERFDFVLSNHVLHHLDEAGLRDMLASAYSLCRRRVLFVDLERDDLAYALFAVITWPFFRRSYIRPDGLISLRRSYTRAELGARAPPGWRVQPLFPFRLVLSRDVGDDGG